MNFALQLLCSFNYFYDRNEDRSVSGQLFQQFNGYGFSINSNVFQDFHGGAIYINSDQTIQILIEECMFISCTHSGNGGAIYLVLRLGDIIQNKICASNCYTYSGGSYQYAYLHTPNTKRNEAYFMSITKCGAIDQTWTKYYPIYFHYGKMKINNINVSKNYVHHSNSITIHYCNTLSMNYLTIIENSASQYYNMALWNPSGVCNISNMNYVDNWHSLTTHGSISLHNGFTFNDCIFLNNYPILFHGPCIINRAYIKHPNTLVTGGVLTTIAVISTNLETPTQQLDHFSTYFCYIPLEQKDLTACATLPPTPTQCQISVAGQIYTYSTFFPSVFLINILLIF